MGLSYSSEKLYSAVSFLASSSKGLHERLNGAFQEISVLRDEGDWDWVPEESKEAYNKVQSFREEVKQTKPKDQRKGTIQEAIEALSEDEAHELAKAFFSLFYEVTMRYGRWVYRDDPVFQPDH